MLLFTVLCFDQPEARGYLRELVQFETHGRIGVIRVDNPPVNALSFGVPEGIARRVELAQEDPSIDAVVVIGSGRTFVAGADINEFVRAVSGEAEMPVFHGPFNRVEASHKPVVMAIHGTALGGGLELAMAGHYRVAVEDAQVGQPEVKIGLIPGAGGTQRLPRLAGVRKAAEMCSLGEPVSAHDALAAGIIDEIVEGDLLEGALDFARRAVARGPRRTRDVPVAGDAAALAELRERCAHVRRNQTAPLAALDAIGIATRVPFQEGCRQELEIFKRCLWSDQSKALIHAFFAERAASKVPDLPKDAVAYPIREAAVIGAGTMGSGIAMVLADAGIPVRLRDTNQEALGRAMAAIRKNYERGVASGRMAPQALEQRIERITPQLDLDGFGRADVIIEAVFESLDLKQAVFQEMDRVAKPECLLASNTSTLDLDAIAAVTSRPEMVIGTHFFSPAHVMRLLEIVRGAATCPAAIATVLSLAKMLKKVPVVVRNAFGFVGNRMVVSYMNQAMFLVEEGAPPEQVDRVLYDFGMAMGPFAVADLSGLDVFWNIEQERVRRGVGGARAPLGLPMLVAMGRRGQKTGAGWYRYKADRKPAHDPEVVDLVQNAARAAGIRQRSISDNEILDRCLYALVNEGARVLEEGIALRAGDIDVVYLTGYGFPSYRGGPMFYAGTIGLGRVRERIQEFGWEPAAVLERLADEGKSFGDWDLKRPEEP
jgi:3-hydroxyacyl-CoA dehydrogenase